MVVDETLEAWKGYYESMVISTVSIRVLACKTRRAGERNILVGGR